MDLLRRGNDALKYNPVVAINDLTVHGSDFLWMIFSVMAAATVGVGIWCAVAVPRGQRKFHHLSMMITSTASVAYFCMASDLGATAIQVEFLLLVTGLPLSDLVITVFADEVMIVTGLVGALVTTQYKWGLYSIGCFAMLFVFYQLYFPGRQSTRTLGKELSRTYLIGVGILSFLCFLYPIAWGLCEGGNVISLDTEMIFYEVLDLCAKPVFALVHLFSLRHVDFSGLHLKSGKYSEFAGDASQEKESNHGSVKKTSSPTGPAIIHPPESTRLNSPA